MAKHFLGNFYDEYGYESEKFEALNQFYVKLGTDLLNLAASSNSSSYLGSIETYKYIPAQLIGIGRAKYRVRDIIESYEFGEIVSGPQLIDKESAWRGLSAKKKASVLDKVGRFIELDGVYPGTEDIVEKAEVLGFEVFSEYGRQLVRNVDYYYSKNRFYMLKFDKLPAGSEFLIFKDIAIDINMPERKFLDKIKIPYNSTLTKNEYNEMAYALIRIALGGFTVGNLNKALSFIGEAEGGVFAYDRLTAPEDKRHLWGDEDDNDDPYKHLNSPLTRFDFVVSAPIGEEGTRRMDIVRAFMNRLRLKHTSFVIIPRMSLLDEYDLGMMGDNLFMRLMWRPWDNIEASDFINRVRYKMFRGDGVVSEWSDCEVGSVPSNYDTLVDYDGGRQYDLSGSSMVCIPSGSGGEDCEISEVNDRFNNPWCQVGVSEEYRFKSSFNDFYDRLALYRDFISMDIEGMRIQDFITAEEAIHGIVRYIADLTDGFSSAPDGRFMKDPEYDDFFNFDSLWVYDDDPEPEWSHSESEDDQFAVTDNVLLKSQQMIKTAWDTVYNEALSTQQRFNLIRDYIDAFDAVKSKLSLDVDGEVTADEVHRVTMAFTNLVASVAASDSLAAELLTEYGENVAHFDYVAKAISEMSSEGFIARDLSAGSFYDVGESLFDAGALFDLAAEISVLEQFIVDEYLSFGKEVPEMYNRTKGEPEVTDSIDEAEDSGITIKVKDKSTGEEREVDL